MKPSSLLSLLLFQYFFPIEKYGCQSSFFLFSSPLIIFRFDKNWKRVRKNWLRICWFVRNLVKYNFSFTSLCWPLFFYTTFRGLQRFWVSCSTPSCSILGHHHSSGNSRFQFGLKISPFENWKPKLSSAVFHHQKSGKSCWIYLNFGL